MLSSELNLDEKRAENNQDELFTPREREILVLIIAEVSVQEIAKRLYISTHTPFIIIASPFCIKRTKRVWLD